MDEVARRAARHLRRRVNSADHMDRASTGVDLGTHVVRDERSVAVHAAGASCWPRRKRRGVDWRTITGTSNQSDYLCISSPTTCSSASRCPARGGSWATTSRSATSICRSWNPMSVVGQHMQQAGATPAEAMALHAEHRDPVRAATASRAAWTPTTSCRASRSSSTSRSASSRRSPSSARARRIWARIARERLGAKDPRSWRFKFHGADLGRRPDAPAAAQQHRARHRAGDGRHPRRPAVAAHRRLRRGAVGARRETARASRSPPRTSCARKRT